MNISTTSKTSVLLLLGALCFLSVVPQLSAQNTNNKTLVAEVIDTSVTTNDGWQIAMTYYRSDVGKEAPVVILLHGERGNRLVWKAGFAKTLHKQGYAVVAVDLRKHGDSRPVIGNQSTTKSKKGNKLSKFDYQRMVTQDLEAVKSFLLKEHAEQRLNIKKMGIVGSDMSTVVALNYAVRDWLKKPYNDAPTLAARTPRGQDIQAIVLLSPKDSAAGMSSGKAVMFLRSPLFGIAFLTCVGERDSKSKKTALKIQKQLTASSKNKERMHQYIYPKMKLSGTNLLSNKLVANNKTKPQVVMLGFFNKYLKQRDIPWQTRKSKLFD